MMTEILQHLDALHAELSTIDPVQHCNAAEAVANIARALQCLVASTPEHGLADACSTISANNAA